MVGRALVALSLLAACGGEPASAEPPPPTPEPPQFRAQAHREAWARLPALAEAALVASDPLARAQLDDDAPVDLPPHGAGAIIDARRVLDSAWREAKDLDAALLEPEARALLRAIRFALSRARDGLSRRPPARTDPNVIVTELDEALTILAARGTECTACDAARERCRPPPARRHRCPGCVLEREPGPRAHATRRPRHRARDRDAHRGYARAGPRDRRRPRATLGDRRRAAASGPRRVG
ncbi:MAG: hypothetical protein IPN32_24875 [Deltaproteobacteria bacterium]|nr:hypothetical protein [Deltaproteobacteria bacterium]